jgi:cell division protease FtsH
MIDEQLVRAKDILINHKDQLERLALALLEHELLDREEILKVIAGDVLQTAKKTRSLMTRPVETPDPVTVGAEIAAVASEAQDKI